MSQAFKKFEQLKRKVHGWKSSNLMKEKELEEKVDIKVTKNEVKCQSCGFVARYKFVRCPQCNELQK